MATTIAGYDVDPGRPSRGVEPGGGLVHLARRPPGARVDDEVAALLAAPGPHVPRLIDVATEVNGDVVLVVEHLPHRLARLIAVPGWPTLGEAVTVLAPLAQTVAALGAARVRHGAIGVGSVRFDDAGRPVLTRFAGAAPFGPADDGSEDRVALLRLAEVLLERCGASDLALRLADDRPLPAALAEMLFDAAPPRPVRLAPESAPRPPTGPPGRLVEVPAADRQGAGAPARTRRRALAGLAVLRARITATARRRPLRTVRRRVWLAAGGSALLLAAAVVLLPSHPETSAAEQRPVSGSANGAASSRSAAVGRDPAPSVRPTAGSSSSSASAPAPGPPPAPVAAVAALLRQRAACLDRSRTGCLAGVDDEDSPLLADDLLAIDARADAPRPAGAIRLLQRAGSTALLTVGGATILAVHGPEGWRLRDLVASG